MKNYFSKPLITVLALALMLPATLLAQKEDKDKESKEKKEKDKDKTEIRSITITRNGNKDEKIVVEVNGDKVTVNGKPIEEYKGNNVIVNHNRNGNAWSFGDGQNSWGFNGNFDNNDNMSFFGGDSNRAMLGVTTDKADKGVEIQEITSKESAAAKAGLKEGDVITKVDDKSINDPDALTEVIRSHKPGDKVSITILRDDKEQKVTAELGKWKGVNVFAKTPKMDLGNMDFDYSPKITVPNGTLKPYTYSRSGGGPKLGLSVQDTDDGKGVKVIEVDEESNAKKAGIKEDDVITEVEGKTVNSADEVAKIIKESKDKNSVMVKLTRNGKTQNIEVKIPRKLKTADL